MNTTVVKSGQGAPGIGFLSFQVRGGGADLTDEAEAAKTHKASDRAREKKELAFGHGGGRGSGKVQASL